MPTSFFDAIDLECNLLSSQRDDLTPVGLKQVVGCQRGRYGGEDNAKAQQTCGNQQSWWHGNAPRTRAGRGRQCDDNASGERGQIDGVEAVAFTR